MIQLIRITHKKEDNMLALYVKEFLQFIGCLTTDCIINDKQQMNGLETEPEREPYDAEIIIFGPKECNEKSNIINIQLQDDVNELSNANVQKKVMKQLIEGIWKDSNEAKELLLLSDIYVETNMFYYVYQEGNYKFMREVYALGDAGNDTSALAESRMKSYEATLKYYVEFYNKMLECQKDSPYTKSVYSDYAELNLGYRINYMAKLVHNQIVFETESILENLWKVAEKNKGFVRIYHLAASICKKETRYWSEVEDCYYVMLEKVKRQGFPSDIISFILEQWGSFQKEILNDSDKAMEKYKESYSHDNNNYVNIYNMLEYKNEIKDYKSFEDFANKIIDLTLNGIDLSDVMLKEKIYAFKTFVNLGDVYVDANRYDLGLMCYQRAELIFDSKNVFFSVWNKNIGIEGVSFESCFKSCMEIQPLYFKIINCASLGDRSELTKKYYEKLYQN